VKTIADLRGKQVSVDALTTGYAFVLRKILNNAGLKPEEFEFVRAGGVMQRYQALMKKEHAATLLISPFEVNAEAAGFTRLADGSEALGNYQGLVGATRRSWAKENEAQLIGYIRGYREGLDWLYNPANKAEAIAILRKNVPNLSEDLAAKSYDILLHPKNGRHARQYIDIERYVLVFPYALGPVVKGRPRRVAENEPPLLFGEAPEVCDGQKCPQTRRA